MVAEQGFVPKEGLSSTVRGLRLRPTSALLAVAFATDLRLERGTEGQRRWTYSFNLVIASCVGRA